jgi:hypothetical protein
MFGAAAGVLMYSCTGALHERICGSAMACSSGPEGCGKTHIGTVQSKHAAVLCLLAAEVAMAEISQILFGFPVAVCAESLVPYAEWYFCSVAPYHAILRTIYIVSSGC